MKQSSKTLKSKNSKSKSKTPPSISAKTPTRSLSGLNFELMPSYSLKS
jgi:hypothetical protein